MLTALLMIVVEVVQQKEIHVVVQLVVLLIQMVIRYIVLLMKQDMNYVVKKVLRQFMMKEEINEFVMIMSLLC